MKQAAESHNAFSWSRVSLALLLVMVLPLGALAQQSVEPQARSPQASAQAQPKETAKPEHRMTEAEKQELFASFDQILKFASNDTGLPIKGPVNHKVVGRDEVEKYMLERMKEDPDTLKLDRSEISLKKFGLIPKDMNLRSYLVALLKEQIAGFYDSKTKIMYMLDWVDPASQKPVLAHELTHALQDQNFDLEKWGQVNDKKLNDYDEMVRDEQRAARQAAIEGQATVVLVDYFLSPYGKSVASDPDIVDQIKKQMVSSGSTPLFAKAPTFLKLALMFPYDSGFDFERTMLAAGGKLQGYAGVFRNPPDDTRQILEPKTYLDQQHQPLPKLADLPKVVGKDFEKFDDGGFGEFDVQIMVKQWMPSTPPEQQSDLAAAASKSVHRPDADLALVHAWRGGYYMSFHRKSAKPEDKDAPVFIAFFLHLATEQAAKNFENVYRSGLKQRYKSLAAKPGGVIETEDGPVTLTVDGEWFTATEGFDTALARKISDAMLTTAREGSNTASKPAAAN